MAHDHELAGEWYRHDHDGGDEPHSHKHTAEQAEEHEEAAEDDGTCPVCGEIHELAPDEVKEAEEDEHAADEGDDEVAEDDEGDTDDEGDGGEVEDDDEDKKERHATPVSVPPQSESPAETHHGHTIETSAWHAHRGH